MVMDGRGDHGEPVAIIGVACRFPGARDPAEFHELAVTGRRMFQPAAVRPGRPLRAALLDDWTVPPGAHGDYLCDYLHPGQSGLDPVQLDLEPVQKLATETTALALTDAGLREAAGNSRTGMIIASTAPGLGDLVSGQFGFAAGGSYPPAALASSLHAVAAAAAALQAGRLDLAIAGGAELGLDPVWLALQARAGTLGTDEMRVYAADPAGLLPGDGCGIVILVRAADARAAGVPVYAEIAGWSTVPAGSPELAGPALERAYRRAGTDPADIQYIEGQGTGTAAADSAELTAFTRLRQSMRVTAALGAVSAGIGYTRAAAGIASLIKTAAAMAAGTIPPGPGSSGPGSAGPHPLIASGAARLRLPDRPEPWPDGDLGGAGLAGSAGVTGSGRPRLAAVHSLGTADPALLAGQADLGDAEGIHLVLRREGEGERWAGRRRRRTQADGGRETAARGPAAQGVAAQESAAQEAAAQESAAQESAAQEAAAREAAGRGPAAPGVAAQELAGQVATGRGAAVQEPGVPGRHTMARGAGVLGRPEQPRVPGLGRPVPALEVRERAGPARVFVLRGRDRGTLAEQLDVIAASAAALSDDGLERLARQLALSALQTGDDQAGHGLAGDDQANGEQAGDGRASGEQAGDGRASGEQGGYGRAGDRRGGGGLVPLRIALTATGPRQLAGLAGEAAGLLRTGGPAAGLSGRPDVRVSAGACGAVVVLFPGRAESPAGQPALLASSLAALAILDVFGVRPTTGVGYGLAEITGLAWAGCIPAAEAARLVAQCGQVLRACACGTAAMARVAADEDLVRALGAPGRLHIAAYEGPGTYVLAGSTAGVRELTRRAGLLKVPVEVLDSAAAMHSPGMARCAAPLRSVLAATSFAPPRRRLVSTVTGRLVTPEDDLAWLLAAQVTRPVLFAQAMAQAAGTADLIVIAGPEAGLASRAAECGGVPAVAIPAGHGGPGAQGPRGGHGSNGVYGVRPGPEQVALAQAVAALFAAGAITDLAPFLSQDRASGSGGPLARRPAADVADVAADVTVPRMRTGEPLSPARPAG